MPPLSAGLARFGTISSIFMAHLPEELFQRTWDPYWYPFNFLPLAASAQAIAIPVQIESDKDFVACFGVRTITDPANEATFVAQGSMTAQIQSQGNNLWMPGPVHIENLFGTAQLPAIWPVARFVPRNSQLTVTLTNLIATARNVRIAIGGFSVY